MHTLYPVNHLRKPTPESTLGLHFVSFKLQHQLLRKLKFISCISFEHHCVIISMMTQNLSHSWFTALIKLTREFLESLFPKWKEKLTPYQALDMLNCELLSKMTQHQKLVGDRCLVSASAPRLNGILVNINFESMWIALSFPGPELSMQLSKFKFCPLF